MATLADLNAVFSILGQHRQPTMLEQLEGYTPFQLLIATLLSSRTKDITTIPIVKRLFENYPAPSDLAEAKAADLEKSIYGIGFYRVKARQLKKLSAIILEKYGGEIPQIFEELTSLPGVGRKTANCILSYAFHKPAIAVDTHVHRIANRIGWIQTKAPEETEEALQKIVPTALWGNVNKLLVDHGQRICLPRNPHCENCPILKYCEYGKSIP